MPDFAASILKPERPIPQIQKGFDIIAKRMVRKRFHAALATPEALELLASLDAHEGPALLCINHPGWWDPMTLYAIGRTHLASRYSCGPIEMKMLEQRSDWFSKIDRLAEKYLSEGPT